MKNGLLIAILLLQVNAFFCQNEKISDYNALVDSAFHYKTTNQAKMASFLEAIPKPIEEVLDNKKGLYYYLQSVLFKTEDNLIRAHESFILSIKYAENERDYKTAGDASHELALSLYSINENEQAEFYIKNASEFYTKINDKAGMLNVLQIPAYRSYLDHEYRKCIRLTNEHIDKYESFEKDQYYNLLANSMLVSSYMGLDNIDTANLYYSQFNSLQYHPTIKDYDYQYFNDFLYIDYINYYFRHDEIDSCFKYLSILEENKDRLDHTAITEMYLFFIDIYKKTENKEKEIAYLDSLRLFKEQVLSENVKGTFEVHKSLIESDKKLESANNKSNTVLIIAIVLLLAIIVLLVIYYSFKQKTEAKFNALNDELTLISFIDSNHEKLKIKTKNLEEYIIELKKVVKSITKEKDIAEQQNKINELYKELHLKAANSPGVGGSHSELVNKLNAKFFVEIQNLHPDLNESEIVICYYISIGFKNKEIAVFLNSSLRSIESKRFRISKKINLPKEENLADYLTKIYKTLKSD